MNPACDDRNLIRNLVSALAYRDGALILPVLVPANADIPPINPLTVLLLAEIRRLTFERDAFKAWVTQDPAPPSDIPLRAITAEAAGNLARRDSP
ncbi:hypothetical protein [Streptomyces sp. NPDC092903]|uniref:hypothetical protein n=1 Tax=Streptomyces sp. NPDC092903 TaxID=3366017 RepID=UPI00382510EC